MNFLHYTYIEQNTISENLSDNVFCLFSRTFGDDLYELFSNFHKVNTSISFVVIGEPMYTKY